MHVASTERTNQKPSIPHVRRKPGHPEHLLDRFLGHAMLATLGSVSGVPVKACDLHVSLRPCVDKSKTNPIRGDTLDCGRPSGRRPDRKTTAGIPRSDKPDQESLNPQATLCFPRHHGLCPISFAIMCIAHTMNSTDLIKQLEKAGWRLQNIKGSHHVYKHPKQSGHLSVPHPKKDLGIGLVTQLLRQAGMK